MTTTQTKPIGSWRGGWLLARAAWSTLKLDKELLLFPFYSFIISAGLTGLIALAIWLGGWSNQFVQIMESADSPSGLYWYLSFGVYYLALMFIANFFAVALISAAFHRFNHEDPTIAYGLSQAKRKLSSIFQFTLLSSTVGILLQAIEENGDIPIVGRALAWIADISWHVVTVFALPVIAASDTPVGPITAAKKSAQVFSKVWDKGFTGGLGIGAIFAAAAIPMFFLSLGITVFGLALNWSFLLVGLSIVAAWVPFITLATALNSIFHAALYHYAETGESPEQFDKELLQAAFKPKKKWFV